VYICAPGSSICLVTHSRFGMNVLIRIPDAGKSSEVVISKRNIRDVLTEQRSCSTG